MCSPPKNVQNHLPELVPFNPYCIYTLTFLICLHFWIIGNVLLQNLTLLLTTMVIWLVEFSREGSKIRNVFCQKLLPSKEIFWIDIVSSSQKMPKSDFQSQLSMSTINRIFLFSFFIQEYQFSSTFFVKRGFLITSIFSKMMPNFWPQFLTTRYNVFS